MVLEDAAKLAYEFGMRLRKAPRAPGEQPVTDQLHYDLGVAEWKLFFND